MRWARWAAIVGARSRYPGTDDVGVFPFLPGNAVIVGNGELDRIDAGEISVIQRMLAPWPALRLLAEDIFQRIRDRIKRGNHRQAEAAALFLQQRKQTFLLGDQPVDASGFAVEVV